MSDVFPKWANRLPRNLAIVVLLSSVGIVLGVTYYFTPKFTQVGYAPRQPVAFSHKTHAAQTGVDCRYCHNGVEKSAFAMLPASSTCINCHGQILKDDARLALVRESVTTGTPIPWVRVQRLPDFVYFSHTAHVNRGVGCVECHGRVDQMEEMRQDQPLTMTFCLNCHRNPATRLRPIERVYSMDWAPTNITTELAVARQQLGTNLARTWAIKPGQSCSTCHR